MERETITYLIVPSVFLFFGGIAKHIIRGSEWIVSDWFLGVELALGALSTSFGHLFDLIIAVNRVQKTPGATIPNNLSDNLWSGLLFIFVALCMFFLVVVVHQRWEKVASTNTPLQQKAPSEKWKLFWLLGVCNFIGYMLFLTFVVLVKGIPGK